MNTKRRLERLNRQLQALHQKMLKWRVIIFAVSMLFSILSSFKDASVIWAIAAGSVWLVFFGLVFLHRVSIARGERLRWRMELQKRIQNLEKLDLTAKVSLDETWYSNDERVAANRLLRDLDIDKFLGLFPFFLSADGRRKFVRFLTIPLASVDEVKRRQQAIGYWERHPVLRRKILRVATAMEQEIDATSLLRLIRQESATKGADKWFMFVAGTQIAFFVLWISGLAYGTKLWGLFGLILLAGAYYFASRRVDIFSSYSRAVSVGRSLRALKETSQILQRVASHAEAQVQAFRESQAPSKILEEVEKAAGALGVRQNPILALLINFLIPWDLYWTLRFERARLRVESQLPLWLETLAELEAFLVAAEWNKAHGQVLPEFLDENKEGLLEADNLAHPLLPADRRVANSIRLDDSSRCHLVTGSNMSGKSTFLRSIGLNILLAQAGLKVVATKFRLSRIRLESSMRPSDSLEDGFSSFYSEVSDLVEILARAKGPDTVFYLVDEIFRGTNNRERRIGAESVIRAFSNTHAMGLVTTHDLDLAALEGQVAGLKNHHFRDDVIGGKMTFTYEYRTGPCPSTNALKVMRLAGLEVLQ